MFPNINSYTSVVAGITYGSKKCKELVENDWTGRLKRWTTDIKKLTDKVIWNCWIKRNLINKDIDYIMDWYKIIETGAIRV